MEQGREAHTPLKGNQVLDEEQGDTCGSIVTGLLWFLSMLLIIVTFPFSLCACVRIVQVINALSHTLTMIYLSPHCIKNLPYYIDIIYFTRNMNGPSSFGWERWYETGDKGVLLDQDFFSLSHAWTTLRFAI